MNVTSSSSDFRKLKALAQRLKPILFVGKAGLSDALFKSLHEALLLHELVKVKFVAFKENKKNLAIQMAQRSKSHLVARVGNMVVLYRSHPSHQKTLEALSTSFP